MIVLSRNSKGGNTMDLFEFCERIVGILEKHANALENMKNNITRIEDRLSIESTEEK